MLKNSQYITLSVPGKIFLLGEYHVLMGGAAWLISMAPGFSLTLRPATSGEGSGVCLGAWGSSKNNTDKGAGIKGAAAGFLKEHAKFFKALRLSFRSHCGTKGGLGSSSAAFVLLYAAYVLHQNKWHGGEGFLQKFLSPNVLSAMFKSYQKHSTPRAPLPEGFLYCASGADAICQALGLSIEHHSSEYGHNKSHCQEPLSGGFAGGGFLPLPRGAQLVYFKAAEHGLKYRSMPCSFQAQFMLTGLKVPTHGHIKELLLDTKLCQALRDRHSFWEQKAQCWFKTLTAPVVSLAPLRMHVQEFQRSLLELGLLHPHSIKLMRDCAAPPYVLKGCGAQGADVILKC